MNYLAVATRWSVSVIKVSAGAEEALDDWVGSSGGSNKIFS